MRIAVTITPLKVEADSRTFKQAASMKRFGFLSIVVEAEASALDLKGLPFELLSMKSNTSNHQPSFPKSPLDQSICFNARTLVKKISHGLPNALKDPIKFVLFVIHYFYRAGVRPLFFIPKASLYYLHAPYLFPAVWLLSRWYRVPYIYDAHDFYIRIEENYERSALEQRWIDPFYKKVEEICIRHAAMVVTVNESIAQLMSESFHVRPSVIRSCQDLRLEKPSHKYLRTALGLSQSDFLLVSIGNAKKGLAIRECIEAMTMLPSHVHLAFVGRNHEQYFETIQHYGLEHRVHVVQPVKPFEVISFVQSADAAVILYYPRSVNYEFSLPNKFFQSVSAGLPLLYPELPEIRKLSETYRLGIPIDPTLPGSIAAAVKSLLDNSELKSKYRENACLAREELSWEREENLLQNLIAKVLRN